MSKSPDEIDLDDIGLSPPVKQKSPALFNGVEDKTDEALATFVQLEDCTYSSKHLGSSGQQEYMTCDCVEDWDSSQQKNFACGDDSNCINRVTSVECVNGHCNCGKDCQNQRFQKHQYAKIGVFQTELKGYGVRALETIPSHTFIYEYIGEVIGEDEFRQRMIEYDSKNFKHFYFMMLKQDSFIDATMKGSLARFCNHSCNPNVFVDKWVVGKKLRMGLFAKRTISKGEELTFDYNVDRYGAQSQPCYCGEPNCIGFMGGKTQTDAALLLPDGIAEALGVTPKQEKMWLKENKHLRIKQQDDDSKINEEFIRYIQVSAVNDQDVNKVIGALMKSQDINIIRRLVERIYKTVDESVNSLFIRFHGYKTLATILRDYQEDEELIENILTILTRWPKVTKNKISSSQIEDVIKDLNSKTNNEEIKMLATDLLDEWSKLQMAYRIPKTLDKSNTINNAYGRGTTSPEPDRTEETYQTNQSHKEPTLPDGWEMAFDENTQKPYYFNRKKNLSRWTHPAEDIIPTGPRDMNKRKKTGDEFRKEEERLRKEKEEQFNEIQRKQKLLQEMILQSQEADRVRREQEEKARQEQKLKAKAKAKSRATNGHHSSSSVVVEANWKTLFARHVPNLLKKYEPEIGKENCKGCSKDLVKILVSKEMKRDTKESPPAELDKHKLKKIKEYSKGYMDKFLINYRAKKALKKRSSDKTNDENDAKKAKVE
jgi:histone-lysine N-methyltransferase SETD2